MIHKIVSEWEERIIENLESMGMSKLKYFVANYSFFAFI